MQKARYQTFNGADVERIPFLGRRVALLAEREDLDPVVVARILEVFDRAADFYAAIAGREPKPNRLHENRITITEVSGIGGACWAYLGETGIEIQPSYLDILYRGVRDQGLFDQPLFYELGRNWWFWFGALDVHPGSVCTGWAVYMRFLSMDAAGVKGAPYLGWPFDEFRGKVNELLDVFARENASPAEWRRLLGTSPAHVHTFQAPGRDDLSLSTADLIAALFDRLVRAHGGPEFLTRMLRAAESLPAARNGAEICANFLAAASTAAGSDLTQEFAEWKWPPPPIAGRLRRLFGRG